MPSPICPHCRVALQEGVLIDRGHAQSPHVQKWMSGDASERENSFLGIKARWFDTTGREERTVSSWRCPKCGILQNYAN